MKTFYKTICITLGLILPLFTLASGGDGHEIKIKVKGFAPGTNCILGNYYGDKQYIKDSAKVGANGEIEGDSELISYIENADNEDLINEWTSTLN